MEEGEEPMVVLRRAIGAGCWAWPCSGYRTDQEDVLKAEKSFRSPVVEWMAVDSLQQKGG